MSAMPPPPPTSPRPRAKGARALPGSNASGLSVPAPTGGGQEAGLTLGLAQSELGRLLEDFRQLHREFSEEVKALRGERRTLRPGQEEAHGARGSRRTGAAVRGDEQGMQADALRPGTPVREDAGGDEQGKQHVMRPLKFAQVVDRMRKGNFTDTVRKQRSDGSPKARQMIHNTFKRIFITNFEKKTGDGHAAVDPMECLNFVTMVVAIFSLVFFGISIDHAPSSIAWILVEGVTVLYFVVELTIKIWYYNYRDEQRAGFFFHSGSTLWNWLDAMVTFVQVIEYFVLLMMTVLSHDNVISFLKVSLYIRGLRIIRSLQETSIMRLPVLKHLTRMLVGFVHGLPSLLWVFLLIWVVIGIMSMVFRLIVRADDTDIDLMEFCGTLDNASFKHDEPLCEPYKVLGNEFCGTVGECMFTVFRCILGDCSDTTGKSLVPIMSEHYGLKFNIVYAGGMIFVLLGIFNVVTAVFVQSIETEIKEEDRRYKKRHEWTGDVIKRRLEGFCDFLESSPKFNPENLVFEEMKWDAVELTRLFTDPDASRILRTLDIDTDEYVGTTTFDENQAYNQFNKHRLVDVFGIDEGGTVDAEMMLTSIARIQGEAHVDTEISNFLRIQRLDQLLHEIHEQLKKPSARQSTRLAPSRPGAGPTSLGTGPSSPRSAPAPAVIGVTPGPAARESGAEGGSRAETVPASSAQARRKKAKGAKPGAKAAADQGAGSD